MIFNSKKTVFFLVAAAALAPVTFGQPIPQVLDAPPGFISTFGSDNSFATNPFVDITFTPVSDGTSFVRFRQNDANGTTQTTVTFIVSNCDSSTAGGQGDPHFKTWRGKHYDFHGECCDLILLHSSAFESGLGLDVHIRTKIRRDMSYISSAALRIGSDVLEVERQGVYYLNGVLSAALPAEFSGFAFSHTQPTTDNQHVFEVCLGGRERIKLKPCKDFVSVLIEKGHIKHFADSVGLLMGDFRTGHMVARDGTSKAVIDDANAFGQEWQVLDTEPSLFQTVHLPQHPQQVCTLPTPMQASSQLRRRLPLGNVGMQSMSLLSKRPASCEHWGEGKAECVFDVLTTGDLEMAVVGAY